MTDFKYGVLLRATNKYENAVNRDRPYPDAIRDPKQERSRQRGKCRNPFQALLTAKISKA